MKPSGKSKEQVQGLQKPVPQKRDLRTAALKEIAKVRPKIRKTGPAAVKVEISKTLGNMLADLRALTGTRHDEVAFRIVDQIGTSLVRPKPRDVDSTLINAISTIAEMAPQNVTEERPNAHRAFVSPRVAAHLHQMLKNPLWRAQKRTWGSQTGLPEQFHGRIFDRKGTSR